MMVVTQNVGLLFDCFDGPSDGESTSAEFVKRCEVFVAALQEIVCASTPLSGHSISSCDVDVLVIHFQEVGGKWCGAANLVFFESLIVKKLLAEGGWTSGFLWDEVQNATALGSILFTSRRMVPITSLRSIPHGTYVALEDDPCTYGGSRSLLFHAGQLKDAKGSRKGFLITNLRIGKVELTFCNCHLYHDELNTVACANTVNEYALRRRTAFLEVVRDSLDLCGGADSGMFLFGDFNTRLDGRSFLQSLKRLGVGATVEERAFVCPSSFWDVFEDEEKVREVFQHFDWEVPHLFDLAEETHQLCLAELPVRFPPTYKRCDSDGVRGFSHGRLPAWCDRIFLNSTAFNLLAGVPNSEGMANERDDLGPTYAAFSLPWTDHDGVLLSFRLRLW